MADVEQKIDTVFHRSLAMSVSVALSLLGLAEEYEGFDASIYSMYGALQSDLRDDIRLLFKPFGGELLVSGLLGEGTAIDDLPEFISWISARTAQQVTSSHLASLRGLAEYIGVGTEGIDRDLLEDEAATGDLLKRVLVRLPHLLPHVDRIASLLAHPDQYKAVLIYIVTRFWDQHFKGLYAGWSVLEQESIDALTKEGMSGRLADDFRAITGREYPEEASPPLEEINRVVFIPSCFPGPYLSIDRVQGAAGTLSVVYNCRPTSMASRGSNLPIEEVFGPLKALADETRLEILAVLAGRELYAQQIVDQVQVSQSAVSRHLRLMVACGILDVRKHEGMKFYTINTDVLGRLGARLSSIAGPSNS